MPPATPLPDPGIARRIAAEAEAKRGRLRALGDSRRVPDLPLRYWRQQVYFTTPAGNGVIARKAVEEGFGATGRLFERFGITHGDVAGALEVPEETVAEMLSRRPPLAPLVMVDGEDAQAPTEAAVRAGRQVAAEVFRYAGWDRSTLRFYRPSGLDLPWTADDLADVLLGAGPGAVDGIVFPKAEHPEELEWVDQTLGSIEQAQGVPEHSIKVSILVESAWAIRQLDRLALAIRPRLCGLVLGVADYASDVGLPEPRNDHPTADWARMEIVNVAGAMGVPAIDTMTFDYPVADPALSGEANHGRILARLRKVYDDARHGLALGMRGKWAGHPAQVFAVLLAYEGPMGEELVEAKLAEVEAYAAAVAEGRGAAITGEGMMVDRATDRHARTLLRLAVAQGRLPVGRALRAGVITPAEAVDQRAGA